MYILKVDIYKEMRISVRTVRMVDDDISSSGADSIAVTFPPQSPPGHHPHQAGGGGGARPAAGTAVHIILQQTETSRLQTPALPLESHQVGLTNLPTLFLKPSI